MLAANMRRGWRGRRHEFLTESDKLKGGVALMMGRMGLRNAIGQKKAERVGSTKSIESWGVGAT